MPPCGSIAVEGHKDSRATKYGECIWFLLYLGVNPHPEALIKAVKYSSMVIIRILLDTSTNINYKYNYFSYYIALEAIVSYKNLFRFLLK